MPDQNEPVIPSASVIGMMAKSQLRLAIAAIGGAMVAHKLLPQAFVNDQMIDLVAGAVMIFAAAAWQWARTNLVHSKLTALAHDPAVPDSAARPATTSSPANI